MKWLLKSDPDTYSFADLERDGETRWDGVSNPVALKNIRSMHSGESALVYHTGGEKAIVGHAEIRSEPYPDPKQKDPKLVVVDLKAGPRLARPVTLAEVKQRPEFKDFALVRLPRLSVMPVTDAQWDALMDLAKG